MNYKHKILTTESLKSTIGLGECIITIERLNNKADGTPRFSAVIVTIEESTGFTCGHKMKPISGYFMTDKDIARKFLDILEDDLKDLYESY